MLPFTQIVLIFLLTRLMRGAAIPDKRISAEWKFLLTRLMRGAALININQHTITAISTHAPHARRGDHQQCHQD